MKTNPLEIYIHIPFCVSKCAYCDFYSAPGTYSEQEQYVEALKLEMTGRREELHGRTISSLFIGGGTPSYLPADQIKGLLDHLKGIALFAPDIEITLEANPGTLDREKLRIYREAGINRLSLGLQAVAAEDLHLLGRIHSYEEFAESFQNAREEGFENINVDLISGIPGQTVERFEETIHTVLSLKMPPEHISVYSLILEEETRLYEACERGELVTVAEEVDRAIYHKTAEVLTKAGYRRYEISNYAREGFACRHNTGYWTGAEYIGFGAAAASLLNGTRYKIPEDRAGYIKNPLGSRQVEEVLLAEDMQSEFWILGLRMTDGVSLKEYEKRFGEPAEVRFGTTIEELVNKGLLAYENDRVFLTEYGLDLANYVWEHFL